MNRVDYSAAFWFPVTPDRLWAIVERFDLFESWWGWLRDFRADDDALVDGNVLHGTIVPPVPYRLHLKVRLRRCRRPRLIEAAVNGDLSGRAALRLEDAGDGTRVAVAWSLEMRSAPLRVAARVAYPLMRWGHDRVVEMAVSGFRRRALAVGNAMEEPGPNGGPLPLRP
ncbi:MAG: SRPBCC family protein [Micromonosporaceae bacterium]